MAVPSCTNNTHIPPVWVRGGKQAGESPQPPTKALRTALQPQYGPTWAVPANAVQLGATSGRRSMPAAGGEAPERSESRRPESGQGLVGPGLLDTTAQLRQTAQRTLQKRARAKSLTEALTEGLVGLGDSTPLRFAYRRTLSCAAVLRQNDGVVTGKYCNARWCVVCTRIRTAKLMTKYLPEIETWAEPTFVTLTRPNVTGKRLNSEVRAVNASLRQVGQNVRRGDGLTFRAIRKLEVTYSFKRNDFHPHHHLLVDSRAAANALVERWLEANPTAKRAAQDVRPCTSPVELFKYCTKLVVKGLDNERTAPPPWALDTIFKALKGLRTVQPMGFKAAAGVSDTVLDGDGTVTLDASTPAPLTGTVPAAFSWVSWLHDWVDKDTGEVLSDFSPDLKWLELLARIRRDGS